MKPIFKFLKPFLAIALVASVTSFQLQAAANIERNLPPRFDFSFEGGTAVEFLDQLESETVNFIVPESADIVKIPPFSVKNVTYFELFTALNLLLHDSHPAFDIEFQQAQHNGIWVLQIYRKPALVRKENAALEAEKNERITRVSQEIQSRREERHERLEKRQEELVKQQEKEQQLANYITVPVNISYHLERSSIDGISSLIQSTVAAHSALVPERTESLEIDIKFHRETSILILSGHRDAVRLAQQTLQELRFSPPTED